MKWNQSTHSLICEPDQSLADKNCKNTDQHVEYLERGASENVTLTGAQPNCINNKDESYLQLKGQSGNTAGYNLTTSCERTKPLPYAQWQGRKQCWNREVIEDSFTFVDQVKHSTSFTRYNYIVHF